MVTKGIIVKLPPKDSNRYQVRLPFFENALENSEVVTYEATLSSAAGITQGFAIGDVVYCAFEDNDQARPVIIGKLFLKDVLNDGSYVNADHLTVTGKAVLPNNTYVGKTNLSNVLKTLIDIQSRLTELEKLIVMEK